jgi:hypothetical protein
MLSRGFGFLCFAALFALSACYSGPGTSGPGDAAIAVATPADSNVPQGTVTPRPVAGSYSGIYRALGHEPCCWLSDRANLDVRIPPNATRIEMRVFLPSLAVYKGHPQSLTVGAWKQSAKRFSPLTIGEHVLDYPIHPRPQQRIMTLWLRPGYGFVPAREHVNGDKRLLSMFLLGVTAS